MGAGNRERGGERPWEVSEMTVPGRTCDCGDQGRMGRDYFTRDEED